MGLALKTRRDTHDLPGLSGAWSQALQVELGKQERFLVSDASAYTLDSSQPDAPQILALAARYGAQFVITGTVDDLSIERKQITLGSLFSIPRPGGTQRRLAATLTVYDAYSGGHISRVERSTTLNDDVSNANHPTLKGRFFETPLGATFANLLAEQGKALEDVLACLPMMARVISAEGTTVVIDAGFASGLQPGDRMKVFQRTTTGTLGGSSVQIGTEARVAEFALERVMPETSIGRIDTGITPNWQFGGFARSW